MSTTKKDMNLSKLKTKKRWQLIDFPFPDSSLKHLRDHYADFSEGQWLDDPKQMDDNTFETDEDALINTIVLGKYIRITATESTSDDAGTLRGNIFGSLIGEIDDDIIHWRWCRVFAFDRFVYDHVIYLTSVKDCIRNLFNESIGTWK